MRRQEGGERPDLWMTRAVVYPLYRWSGPEPGHAGWCRRFGALRGPQRCTPARIQARFANCAGRRVHAGPRRRHGCRHCRRCVCATTVLPIEQLGLVLAVHLFPSRDEAVARRCSSQKDDAVARKTTVQPQRRRTSQKDGAPARKTERASSPIRHHSPERVERGSSAEKSLSSGWKPTSSRRGRHITSCSNPLLRPWVAAGPAISPSNPVDVA